jgi:hypothetical protein
MSNIKVYTLAAISLFLFTCVLCTFIDVMADAQQDKATYGATFRKEPTETPLPQPTRTPQPTPTIDYREVRKNEIRAQFSLWDGSHTNLVAFIKSTMHNPRSFQHVSTDVYDNGRTLTVVMVFRGTNAYGAVVTNRIKAQVDVTTGKIIEIME